MNLFRSIKGLTKTQRFIWIGSLIVITGSFCFMPDKDWLTILTSLLGATALIFLGKGDAIGQLISIFFGILYAIISYRNRYYGEMITYLGMTAPSAFIAMISWLKNPYAEREVKVNHLTKKHILILIFSTIVVTVGIGFLLKFFNTNNLLFSIISIATSFAASMLTIFRSPYYAIVYSANDIVLIILWVLASMENVAYIPMIICFLIFLINDIYGFVYWRGMRKRQE